MATHANCQAIYNITIITLRHLLGRCSLYQLLCRYILREVYRNFFAVTALLKAKRFGYITKTQAFRKPAFFASDYYISIYLSRT